MRISGLEPLNYAPDAANMRKTFLNIGERCNVAGSILFKKAIVNNDYDTALSIALKQIQQGADVLDINLDDGLIEGVAAMTTFVNLCIAGALLLLLLFCFVFVVVVVGFFVFLVCGFCWVFVFLSVVLLGLACFVVVR